MASDFRNVYEDEVRARAYSELAFPGTYYLAFRDLPELIARHVRGKRALDFGCGAGRSTRFLRDLGFTTSGIDISEQMVDRARAIDPEGDYRVTKEGDFSSIEPGFDLILSAFTFDNIANLARKAEAFEGLRSLLAPGGCIVSVVSSPEIYRHEWASFSTCDFPGNLHARSGDKVLIVMLDVPDRRPVEDIFCTDEDYAALYRQTGLDVVETLRPLARGDEPIEWASETRVAPWVVYALRAGK